MNLILSKVDRFINNLTMYRLTLYGLTTIGLYSILLAIIGLLIKSESAWLNWFSLPFNPLWLFLSLFLINFTCHIANIVFSKIFKAPLNIESAYITAYILFFIMPPIGTFSFISKTEGIAILVLSGIIAMASKYIFAIHKKHIFNPAAIGALLTGLILTNGQATWWIGSASLLVPTAILGFMIVRKIHRARLFWSFIATGALTLAFVAYLNSHLVNIKEIPSFLYQLLISYPLVFFATIMLTEPLTAPPTKKLQGAYGGLVGILFGTPFHFGLLYMSPQLALVLGNIFTYIVSPKQRLLLMLKKRTEIASNIFHFSFNVFSDKPNIDLATNNIDNQKKASEILKYKPGQYLEWTLPHDYSDTRGNRRYFTIASSPTEQDIAIGVKIIPNFLPSPTIIAETPKHIDTAQKSIINRTSGTPFSSSFKHELLHLNVNDPKSVIVASQVSGDFILPNDTKTPLVFIAGGIGITPFRSMIKYLLDKDEQRNIILFYACTTEKEFAYLDIFIEAEKIGVTFVPVIINKDNVPANWSVGPLIGKSFEGHIGFITKETIEKYVPGFDIRTYYLSGPGAMVDSYKLMLTKIGIPKSQIVTDYFPGF